jgi:hypothetical protein
MKSAVLFQFSTNTLNNLWHTEPQNRQSNEQRIHSLGEIIFQEPELFDTQEGAFTYFRGTLASFKLIQTSCYPNYYDLPFSRRAAIAMKMSIDQLNSPDVIRAVIGVIDSSKAEYFNIFNLFICVAKRFGRSIFEPTYKPSRQEIYGPLYNSSMDDLSSSLTYLLSEANYPLCGWQAFVTQLIRAGVDLSFEAPYGRPLLGVVAGAFSSFKNAQFYDEISPTLEEVLRKPDKGHLALHAWLHIMKNSGVDLETYGRREASILSREFFGGSSREVLLSQRHGSHPGLYLRLIAFEFGPKPEHWKFWFSEPTDQLVGEFWDMIDHPERSMPGAWNDFSW